MEEKTTNVDREFEKRVDWIKILEIILLLLLISAIIFISYQIMTAEQAVKELIFDGNVTSLLKICSQYAGHECVVIVPIG